MEVSILQWNILYSEPIEHIAEFLLAQRADIMCLQELTIGAPSQTIKDTPQYLAERLGCHCYTKELPIIGTDGTKMMLANGIFSRFELTDTSSVWINVPATPAGGFSNEYRAYVEATAHLEGDRKLTIGTTHMSYTHAFEATSDKQHETDRLIEIVKNKPSNYVLTGDLNALPGSYTVNELQKHLRHLGPDLERKSWTTKPFSYHGFEATELDWRLDYAFGSDDINVRSAEILETDYSDHLPVFIKIAI